MGATHDDAEYWRDKIMRFYKGVKKRRFLGVDVLLLHRDRAGTVGNARIRK